MKQSILVKADEKSIKNAFGKVENGTNSFKLLLRPTDENEEI